MSLTGKAALVTGAGQGIGKACAVALAQAGARVAVFDLKQESADATVAALPDPSRHLAIAGNVAAGLIPAEIAVVIGNRPDAGGLEAARQRGLTALSLPSKGLDREAYDRQDEPHRRRVNAAMLAGALLNRGSDIFNILFELRQRGIEIHHDNELLRECESCFLEAFDLGSVPEVHVDQFVPPEGDDVAIVQFMAPHALAVDVDAIRAVQVFHDRALRGGDDLAVIAADELESLLETAHLLRSPKNAERLLTALFRARGEACEAAPLVQESYANLTNRPGNAPVALPRSITSSPDTNVASYPVACCTKRRPPAGRSWASCRSSCANWRSSTKNCRSSMSWRT